MSTYKTFNEIIDGRLWLGPFPSSASDLKEAGITHIVNVTPETDYVQVKHFLHIPIADKPHVDIGEHFEKAYRFIDEAIGEGGRVYVHCVAGVSRSPTIVLYYIMRKYSMPLKDAFALVQSRRSQSRPNTGFWITLCGAEEELLGKISMTPEDYLVEYLEEVLSVPECAVRAAVRAWGGDVRAAELELYEERYGPVVARVLLR